MPLNVVLNVKGPDKDVRKLDSEERVNEKISKGKLLFVQKEIIKTANNICQKL